MASSARWVPLESNPEVLTKYSRKLGATKGEWLDVFALDEESLETIPQPVVSVILLFPISEQYDAFANAQDAELKEKGQQISDDLFYMKQTVSNACGTVGIFHALANSSSDVELTDGILKDFVADTAFLSPLERGQALEKSDKVSEAHEATAQEGQTAAPDPEEQFVTHFVTFVHKGGVLYELDGRREFPVNHGPTTPKSLLKDAAAICKKRMEIDPTEYRFTVVALTTAL